MQFGIGNIHDIGAVKAALSRASKSDFVRIFYTQSSDLCRSRWPRHLRRRSAAARLLRSWVRIPPGQGRLCCVYCQVEVSVTRWSLVQRSPTDCGASLCVAPKTNKSSDLCAIHCNGHKMLLNIHELPYNRRTECRPCIACGNAIVKIAFVKPAYHVTQYSMCSLVISEQAENASQLSGII